MWSGESYHLCPPHTWRDPLLSPLPLSSESFLHISGVQWFNVCPESSTPWGSLGTVSLRVSGSKKHSFYRHQTLEGQLGTSNFWAQQAPFLNPRTRLSSIVWGVEFSSLAWTPTILEKELFIQYREKGKLLGIESGNFQGFMTGYHVTPPILGNGAGWSQGSCSFFGWKKKKKHNKKNCSRLPSSGTYGKLKINAFWPQSSSTANSISLRK